MFNRSTIQTALKRTWELDNNPGLTPYIPADNESSVISQLIYDIFGGEILKTHNKRGWHFYNRINGERIDFTKSEIYGSLHNETRGWGIEIVRTELKEIDPPKDVQETMNKVVKAENEK